MSDFSISQIITPEPGMNTSDQVLTWLQQRFGATKYTEQSVSRYPYYFYTAYPAAGSSEIGFWGSNMSSATSQLTNIEQAGTLGNYSYLITSIGYDIFLYIPTVASNGPWSYTTDALAPYSDIAHGLTQGGVAAFSVNQTVWDQVPLPFMYSPSCIGKNRLEVGQGAFSFTQAGGSPFAVTGSQNVLCFADVERRTCRKRILKSEIFLAPQQTFQQTLAYPFGLIPIISTSVITGSAILYVGARLDGYRFAPVS